MATHLYEIVSTEFLADYGQSAEAVIVIEPPLHTGPGFNEIVLGAKPSEIYLKEILTTETETVFLARTRHYAWEHPEKRHNHQREVFKEMGKRICKLADRPDLLMSMAKEEVFSEPNFEGDD